MITNKELNEVNLSTTKKDYYQIWNELIELADKISERWSPASTNESDPGIVLLKVLTAVADKLNYNIDKNTLEAFMPSATQEDSMRKLTEMMGYDMKHYRSATGKATITYKSSNTTPLADFTQGIYFPKFVNLKNEDEDINYVTLEEFTIQNGQDSREVTIIEGEVIDCETNNDNIITAVHLDDLNRYILPEYAIAENGIFITNIEDSKESALWRNEQNLNIQQPGTRVYKVGFDSLQQLPYIQFPEDVKTLIEDGLKIRYIRTNGLNGNIAAKVLSKLEKPALWSTATDSIKNLGADNFSISNNSACTNGADPESLDAAYNNYKKTVGTFDTLVTCRDYMNKIYQLTESATDTTPLVSNIIVSDIRDDINRSTPVCTFNEYGICYKDMSLQEAITINLTVGEGDAAQQVSYETTRNKIDHFDLIFYPFKTVYGLNNKTEYKNSFKYTAENFGKIEADLALNKNIAHNIVKHTVGTDDSNIACIKNYLKLKARVTTTKKVTLVEEAEILNNIHKAIYKNFNARQIDFGEEIPYETILEVLKKADYRIKEISLDEPALSTKFCLINGDEEALSTAASTEARGNELYNKLVRRNVLAGKISAFKYDNNFISEYDKTKYGTYESLYPITSEENPTLITSITSHFDVGTAFAYRDTVEEPDGYVLKENEVIQFRVPNFKTTKTYPAYVNYFIKLNSTSGDGAIAATFETLGNFLADKWTNILDKDSGVAAIRNVVTPETTTIDSLEKFNDVEALHGALFTRSGEGQNAIYTRATTYTEDTNYYYVPLKPLGGQQSIFWALNNWIKTRNGLHGQPLTGIYRTTGVQESPYGYLIDTAQYKYLPAYNFGTLSSDKEALDTFYVQVTSTVDDTNVTNKKVTADGLGKDAAYKGIPKDGEYKLKSNEYLLINYTDSKKDEAGNETKTVINKTYTEGDIIRANFELIDSSLYNTNHTFSKRDGFSFAGQQPKGMFTLGTNEQIEIRDVVKVELDEDSVYLYWTLNSDDPTKSISEFKFTESYNGTNNAYTLKEGEHLYYTNSKKQDLVYYGSGTTIIKKANTPSPLIRNTYAGDVSEEDIMTYGLAAAIPWTPFDFSKAKGLTIIENQYISLTEGDMIISIDGQDPVDASTMPEGSWNNWKTITKPIDTEYRFAEDENNSHLPPIVIDDIAWAVRSRLDFNMSKTTAQPLYRGDELVLELKDSGDRKTEFTLKPTEEFNWEPVYINSNYTCQAALDTLNTTELQNNNIELKLKISSQNAPIMSNNEKLLLNNYINGETKYTKFDFENLPPNHVSNTAAFTLNINMPTSARFGLIAIYYINDDPEITSNSYIKAKSNSTEVDGLKFFNKDDSAESTKVLRSGLNIIEVSSTGESAVKQLEFYADNAKKSTVVFGHLDIVTAINPKLDYRLIDDDLEGDNDKLTQLLRDLKNSGIATDFYYNIPLQHSNEIDLNAAIEDDLLSSPLAWYDANNVNRKFVISEIDADYLTTGITLTKASRA